MRVSVDAILVITASLLLLAPQPLLPSAGADHPAHVPHAPLIFTNDAQFGNAALCIPNAAMGVVGGCGTSTNPWRISGWQFTGLVVFSIRFTGTSAWVLVQDNSFLLGAAIRVEGANNVLVRENVFTQMTALSVKDPFGDPSQNIEFADNQVLASDVGVAIGGHPTSAVSQVRLLRNSIAGAREAVVDLDDVTGVTITGNTITGNANGLSCPFGGCRAMTISDNDISGNTGTGILGTFFGSGANNILSNNLAGFTGALCNPIGGYASFKGNNVHGNANWGVKVTGCAMDARDSWWGDASGPSGAGTGTGDEIVLTAGGILWDPWLTAPNPNAGP